MKQSTIEEYIKQRIGESQYLNEPTKSWLLEYSSRDTVYSHCNRFEQFLQAIEKTDLQIIQEYKEPRARFMNPESFKTELEQRDEKMSK